MKKETKETINLLSLIIGIVFIVLGLAGSAITIPTKNSIFSLQ